MAIALSELVAVATDGILARSHWAIGNPRSSGTPAVGSGDRLSVSDDGQNVALVTGAKHQPAGNRRAPLLHPAL